MASTAPDGIQTLAGQLGISTHVPTWLHGPLADYEWKGFKSEWSRKASAGFTGLALRARRTARARADGVIEARHLGGHHWVAYGWNESR